MSISYYHNIQITWIKLRPFCTLRTPFDIVFNAHFNYGYHPKPPPQKTRFANVVISPAPGGPQILFLVHSISNLTTKKMGCLPGPVDSNKNQKQYARCAPQKTTKSMFRIWSAKSQTNNVQDMVHRKKAIKTTFRIWPPRKSKTNNVEHMGPRQVNKTNNVQDMVVVLQYSNVTIS